MGSGSDSHHQHQYRHYHRRTSHGQTQDGDHQLQEENPKPKLTSQVKENPTKVSSLGKQGGMLKEFTGKRDMIYEDENQDHVLITSTARICADCKTSKTPLWRSGPHGPKSLCNACGIRYRKRRRKEIESLKMGKGISMKEKKRQVGDEERVLLLLQRKSAGKEEAEAAFLLMALSCGLCVR